MKISSGEDRPPVKPLNKRIKEVASSWLGDLPFAASIALLLISGMVLVILRQFGIQTPSETFITVVHIILFLWGLSGLVIVARGEYRDKYKGIQRGFKAYILGITLILFGWLPLITMLASTLFN